MLAALEAIGADISFGTYVTIADAITGDFTPEAVTANGYKYLDISADELFEYYDGVKRIAGTIAYIEPKYNERMYASRGYVTVTLNGVTNTYYAVWSADNNRSIKTVAEMALDDTTASYTESQIATLKILAGRN